MANRVIHSMQALILGRALGRYIILPSDTRKIELVPIEKFGRCAFPEGLLDGAGMLRPGVRIEAVRVSNGWIYPNHKVYPPIL